MRTFTTLGVTIFSLTSWGINQSLAVQLQDGTVYFAQPPVLVRAITTYKEPQTPSTYYFTLGLSQQAGEPLQQVTFNQYRGLENIRFDLRRTSAEARTGSNSWQRLNLTEVTRDPKTKTVSVTFNPPVPPNSTIKIGLHSIRNPLSGGIYLFGVTAYPAGEKSHGQFIGYGRLQFISPGGRF